jgi:hypothetical protein
MYEYVFKWCFSIKIQWFYGANYMTVVTRPLYGKICHVFKA